MADNIGGQSSEVGDLDGSRTVPLDHNPRILFGRFLATLLLNIGTFKRNRLVIANKHIY